MKAIKRLFDFSRYDQGGDLHDIPQRLRILPPGFFDLLFLLVVAAILKALASLFFKG